MTHVKVFTIFRSAMFIDIRKTVEGHSSKDVVYSFPVELRDAGHVKPEFPATVTVSRYGGYIFVKVKYTCEITLECARCLSEFTKKVGGTVEFTLQSDESEDMGSDDVDTYTYETEDDMIDFSQTVYDDMMVRLPSKPLCSITCPGFENPAAVPEEDEEVEQKEEIDPRWAALSKLK